MAKIKHSCGHQGARGGIHAMTKAWGAMGPDGELVETSVALGGYLAKAIFGSEGEAKAFADKLMAHLPDYGKVKVVPVQVTLAVRPDHVPGQSADEHKR